MVGALCGRPQSLLLPMKGLGVLHALGRQLVVGEPFSRKGLRLFTAFAGIATASMAVVVGAPPVHKASAATPMSRYSTQNLPRGSSPRSHAAAIRSISSGAVAAPTS